MGWGRQDSSDEQTVQEIIDTVRDMHDTADAGPLPGTEES